jgi:malonyl CoA-acyl carrier protein transacylase
MVRTGVLFPGQGSSLNGARELVLGACPELYERCQQLLAADPFARAGESTRFAQPAIFLASLAGWRRAWAAGVRADAFAGHSLGELSALTAAGAWSAEQGLELVVLRARLMAEAGSGSGSGSGSMLALLKGEVQDAYELAAQHGVTVANDNAPGQTVLSGDPEALRAVATAARAKGLRAIELNVTGAFHSPAMAPAMEPLERAVRAAAPILPDDRVHSCLTTLPFADPAAELAQALCAPVRWRETVWELLGRGVERFVDVGPDSVLAGLVRRIAPTVEVSTLEQVIGATV